MEAWNALVDLVDAELVQPGWAKAEKFNIQARKDLSGLKKSMPAIGVIEDDDAHDEVAPGAEA